MLWFTGMLQVNRFTITVMTNRNIWMYDVLYGQYRDIRMYDDYMKHDGFCG